MYSHNSYTLSITEPAREDLEAIAAYSFRHWGERQTSDYMDGLYNAIMILAENPDIGHTPFGISEKIKGWGVGQHVVFYQVREQTVFVMRILHATMDYSRHF